MKRIFSIALCLFVALAVAGCGGGGRAPLNSSGAASGPGGSSVAAPQLSGMDTTAAVAALAAAGLTSTLTQSYDASVPAGTIISQNPAPGTNAPKGSKVEIIVSKGPAPIAVPKVVDKTEAEATKVLRAAGFVVASTQKADDATKGVVVAQDPAGGTAKRGATVRITVSTGGTPVPVTRQMIGTWQANDGTTYEFRRGNRVRVPSGGVVRYRTSGSLLLIFHPGATAQYTIDWVSARQFTLAPLKADGTNGPAVTYKRAPY